MAESLRGRTAVITGAGTGIGRAIALQLAAQGAAIGLLGRTPETLQACAAEITAAGGRACCAPADVVQRAHVDLAFAQIARELGPLHAVIANAGTGGNNPEKGQDRWDEIVRTNLDGAYFSLRAFQNNWAARAPALHAIVISSCVARFGVPGISAYSAAKAGQLGLVRALAAEWAPRARVNAICPGWVETQMAEARMREIGAQTGAGYEAARAELLGATPLARMSAPEEVARLAAFLLSPAGAPFTGQTFDPNNGAWMG